jgi:hypothetical protein
LVLGRKFVAVFLPDCFENFGVGFAVLEPLIEVGVLADALEAFGDAVGDFAVGWRKIRRIGADVLL